MVVHLLGIRSLAIALLAGAITSSGSFSNELAHRHEACAPKHHACGATVSATGCCCGHVGDSSNPAASPEPRTTATSNSTWSWLFPHAGRPDTTHVSAEVTIASTRACPPDLPTLFSDLRL